MRPAAKALLVTTVLGSGAAIAAYAYGTGWFDDPVVRGCEAAVLAVIDTPRSDRRVRTEMLRDTVAIDFDAQNLMGAEVRSTAYCTFALVGEYNSFAFDKLLLNCGLLCVRFQRLIIT